MSRGRPPKELENDRFSEPDIEYKMIDDYEEHFFEEEETNDLLENMGNYRHLEELEDFDV